MMDYSEFCHNFHTGRKQTSGLKTKTAQKDIAEFFMRTALGSRADNELALSDTTFLKWYRGERTISTTLWESAAQQFDEDTFCKELSNHLNEKSLELLASNFNVPQHEGEETDKNILALALTRQFKLLIEGCGTAEDVVAECYQESRNVDKFPQYIQRSYEKYSKLKTLLYTDEERPFDEFFVCNTISFDRYRHRTRHYDPRFLISNATLEKLYEKNPYIVLIGMAGIGKSMMMRHLFLEANQAYTKTGLLPIMVTLRDFGSEYSTLFDLVVNSVHRFDSSFSALNARKLLKNGYCQLLLDGLDEIKTDSLYDFLKQLDELVDMYPENQYVMSTRRFSDFSELPRFQIMWIMPFEKKQSLELIDKLVFCPEEPKIKQKFKEFLDSDLFHTHREFVTNPLLLTLMLMNYNRFAEIPERKYLFYEQAYQTLVQAHDANKLAYKRVFHSVSDISDFTNVFSEFCARSYRKQDYEFDLSKFTSYFNILHSKKRLNLSTLTAENFLYDACSSTCLMYEEGQKYYFLHRSFQEYFFAKYYSWQDDDTIRKLGNYIDQRRINKSDDSDALDMLYELAPEKIEKLVFYPFLESIFDNSDSENDYWRFLSRGYGSWQYIILNPQIGSLFPDINHAIRVQCSVSPVSEILELILRVLAQESNFIVDTSFDALAFDDLLIGKFLTISRTGSNGDIYYTVGPYISSQNEGKFDKNRYPSHRLITDDTGKPIIYAHQYLFPFDLALTSPSRYSSIMEFWGDHDFFSYKIYEKVKEYYLTLTDRLLTEEMDDDDF